MMKIREAQFALRVVQRTSGKAAIVYRRQIDDNQRERLMRVGAISSFAFIAGKSFLQEAVKAVNKKAGKLPTGPFHPLDEEWGPRVACYALVGSGIVDTDKLYKASENLRRSDSAEAAWWLGLMTRTNNSRPTRALRIIAEAVA